MEGNSESELKAKWEYFEGGEWKGGTNCRQWTENEYLRKAVTDMKPSMILKLPGWIERKTEWLLDYFLSIHSHRLKVCLHQEAF